MGYGWNTRSPQDVQFHHGREYNFSKIAERYEQTPPLRGKRKAMDIRPHGARDRCHERIVKVNDNEYYLTNNAYRYYDKYGYSPCRAITFKRNDDGTEVVIVHTPRQYWGDKAEDRNNFIPRQIGIPSTFFFYHYNLPDGMAMHKHHSKNYLAVKEDEVTTMYYTLDKGDVHFTRQVGEKFFKPLIVHRETYRSLDRSKTKEIRKELSSFLEYVRVMTPLAEADRQSIYEDPMNYATMQDLGPYVKSELAHKMLGKGWRGVFRNDDNEAWFNLVQYYKWKCRRVQWNSELRDYEDMGCDPKAIARMVTNSVYYLEKPLKEEPVTLGFRTFDKYRNW